MANKKRLGRSFTNLFNELPPNLTPKRDVTKDHDARCPSCHQVKSGWPDEWRNDLQLPGGRVSYICPDCYITKSPSREELRASITVWLEQLQGRLTVPRDIVAQDPYKALEFLHGVLGEVYTEAQLYRTAVLIGAVTAANKEKP